MKLINVTVPGADEIVIDPLYDLHIGSSKCDMPQLIERLAAIKSEANRFCILGGDVINNSTKDSVGDTYTDTLSPMDQIKMAAKLFEPIKDKILCVTSGNHERRSYKKEGVDLTYFLCSELGIQDRYDYTACLMFLNIDGRTIKHNPILYTIYVTHGDGNGGQTVGGKANGLERRGKIVDADVFITGHTHSPISFRTARYRIDRTHRRLQKTDTLFINASATLDYEEYAEMVGMAPSSTTYPLLQLSGILQSARCKI